jgi:hypothetical protein
MVRVTGFEPPQAYAYRDLNLGRSVPSWGVSRSVPLRPSFRAISGISEGVRPILSLPGSACWVQSGCSGARCGNSVVQIMGAPRARSVGVVKRS